MITLKRILVATDFSDPAEVAVRYGLDIARSYGASLDIVHVIESLPVFYAPELGVALMDIEGNIEAAARRDLDAAITDEDRQTVKVLTVITKATNVASAITEYAKTNGIDLIIVGTHGRGAVSRLLMGSVAERVLRMAPCPVLSVHAAERDGLPPPDSGDQGSQAVPPAHSA